MQSLLNIWTSFSSSEQFNYIISLISLLFGIVSVILGIIPLVSNQAINSYFFSTLVGIWFAISAYSVFQSFTLIDRLANDDLYESLVHQETWEFLDTNGLVVVQSKKLELRFLQNNISAFPEFIWGDGDILAAYDCSPGKLVDDYRNDYRRTLIISLQEIKMRNDELTFTSTRQIHDGFTEGLEWLEVELYNKTQKFILNVIFPRDHQCTQVSLESKLGQIRRNININQEFRYLSDGRQQVAFEFDNLKKHELFTFRWKW